VVEVLERLSDERGLPEGFLEEHVRTATDQEDYPGWWAFDYPNLTGLWGTRYRNPGGTGPDRYRSSKGWGTHLYNPTLAGPNTNEVWLAEGEFDTLTLVYLGLRAVGLPGVTEKGPTMRKEWKLLFETAFVVVAFDNDQTGQGAAQRAAQVFNPNSAIFTPHPPEGNDLNDWLVHDEAGLRAAILAFRQEHGLTV